MAVYLRSGLAYPQQPADPSRNDALIESLGLSDSTTWAGQAMSACLKSLAANDDGVTVVDAALRGDETFVVIYRRLTRDMPHDWLMGTVGDRDIEATLRLMPSFEEDEVPLDPQTYGFYFGLFGVREPSGPEQYSEPDEADVHWFTPTDFRSS